MVASFAHQIQSECYGDNILVYIEDIELEHFITLQQTGTLLSSGNFLRNAVFHSFFTDDSKHNAVTTVAYCKHFIEMLTDNVFIDISTIWENNSGCSDQ